MAGNQEVSNIGVKLTLDASGFSGPIREATTDLNAFQRQASRAGAGVAATRAGGGPRTAATGTSPTTANLAAAVEVSPTQLNRALKAASASAVITIPSLTVTQGTITALRRQIQTGLGAISVSITPTFASSGRYSIQNIMGAMLSMQYGGSPTQGRLAARQAIERYVGPVTHRESGGPVQRGQSVLVGEKRPEVVRVGASSYIERDVVQFRKRDAELAALEYQINQRRRRIEDAIRSERDLPGFDYPANRVRGGGVRGYGGKFGGARPATVGSYRDFQNQLWGEVGRDPGRVFHATDMLPEIRGRYRSEYGTGVYPNSPVYGGSRGSFWSEKPLTAYRQANLLRTSQTGRMRPMYGGVHSESENEYFVTPDRVPLRQLQYWGEDNDWHRFRRGRARSGGGYVRPSRALEARLIRRFGVTDDIAEAGYMTPSGKMLDFSGRSRAPGYRREGDRFVNYGSNKDWLRGDRTVDHRELYGLGLGGRRGDVNREMQILTHRGYARLMVSRRSGDIGVEIGRQFTPEQMRRLATEAQDFNTGALEVDDPFHSLAKTWQSEWPTDPEGMGRKLPRFMRQANEYLRERRHRQRGGPADATVRRTLEALFAKYRVPHGRLSGPDEYGPNPVVSWVNDPWLPGGKYIPGFAKENRPDEFRFNTAQLRGRWKAGAPPGARGPIAAYAATHEFGHYFGQQMFGSHYTEGRVVALNDLDAAFAQAQAMDLGFKPGDEQRFMLLRRLWANAGQPDDMLKGKFPFSTVPDEWLRGLPSQYAHRRPGEAEAEYFAAVERQPKKLWTPGTRHLAGVLEGYRRGYGGPVHASGGLILPSRQILTPTGKVSTKGGKLLAQFPEATQEENLYRIARQLTDFEKRWGRVWYRIARGQIGQAAGREGFGGGLLQAAGVTASVSPQRWWPLNIASAEAIFRAQRKGTLGTFGTGKTEIDDILARMGQEPQWRRLASMAGKKWPEGGAGLAPRELGNALRILRGEDPFLVNATPKLNPFTYNLVGDLDRLTLDTIASQTATSGYATVAEAARHKILRRVGGPNPRQKLVLPGHVAAPPSDPDDLFRMAMEAAHRNVYESFRKDFPHIAQFQAALWTHYRGTPMALGGIVHQTRGFFPSILQTAADWASDPFMAIMSWQQMQQQRQQGRQHGGPVTSSAFRAAIPESLQKVIFDASGRVIRRFPAMARTMLDVGQYPDYPGFYRSSKDAPAFYEPSSRGEVTPLLPRIVLDPEYYNLANFDERGYLRSAPKAWEHSLNRTVFHEYGHDFYERTGRLPGGTPQGDAWMAFVDRMRHVPPFTDYPSRTAKRHYEWLLGQHPGADADMRDMLARMAVGRGTEENFAEIYANTMAGGRLEDWVKRTSQEDRLNRDLGPMRYNAGNWLPGWQGGTSSYGAYPEIGVVESKKWLMKGMRELMRVSQPYLRQRGGPARRPVHGRFTHPSQNIFWGIKPAELLDYYQPAGFSPVWPRTLPSAQMSSIIDQIRGADIEHHVAFEDTRFRGHAIGEGTSVDPTHITGMPWWLGGTPERRRYYPDQEYVYDAKAGQTEKRSYTALDLFGMTGVHNHPDLGRAGREIWRPSTGDIASLFSNRERESWVVTPHHTTILRPGKNAALMADPLQVLIGHVRNEFGDKVSGLSDRDLVTVLNNRRFNLDSRFWTGALGRMADRFGFEFEHYFHPRSFQGSQMRLPLRQRGGRVKGWAHLRAALGDDVIGPPMARLPHQMEAWLDEQGPEGRAAGLWDAMLNGRVPGGLRGMAAPYMHPSDLFAPVRPAIPWVQDQRTAEEVARFITLGRHMPKVRPHHRGGPVHRGWGGTVNVERLLGKGQQQHLERRILPELEKLVADYPEVGIAGLEIPRRMANMGSFGTFDRIIRLHPDTLNLYRLRTNRKQLIRYFEETGEPDYPEMGVRDLGLGTLRHEFGHAVDADILRHGGAGLLFGADWPNQLKPLSRYMHGVIKSWRDFNTMSLEDYTEKHPRFHDSNAEGFAEMFRLARAGYDPYGLLDRLALHRRAAGGGAGQGLYVVGEVGDEVFAPWWATKRVPKRLMDQLPKARNGVQIIGQRRNALFSPPEDGVIFPHRMKDEVLRYLPHAQGGVRGTREQGYTFEPEGIRGPFGRYVPPTDIAGGVSADPEWMRRIPPVFTPQSPGRTGLDVPTFQRRQQAGPVTITATTATVTSPTATMPNVRTPAGAAAVATGTAAARFQPGPPPPGMARSMGFQYPEHMKQLVEQAVQSGGAETAAAAFKAQGLTEITRFDPEEEARKAEQAEQKRVAGAMTAGRRAALQGEKVGAARRRGSDVLQEERLAAAGQGAAMPGRTARGAVAALASWFGGGREEFTKNQMLRVRAETAMGRAMRTTDTTMDRTRAQFEELRKQHVLFLETSGKEGISTETFRKSVKGLGDERRSALAKEKTAQKELADASEKALPTRGNILKNLGVIIGATSAYGMAMQAANAVLQPAMEGGVQALTRLGDQMLGFAPTATRVTNALAEQTAQSHGNVQAIMAQTAAQAGLSEAAMAFVSNALGPTVTAKAAAQAQGATREQFRAAASLGGAPEGLYGGYGGILGTPLLGEQLGGGQGFMEQIAGQFGALGPGVTGGMPDLIGQAQAGVGYVTSPREQAYLDWKARQANMPTPGEVGEGVLGGALLGAGAGAAIGSVVPVVGTVGGAFVGGVAGAIAGGNLAQGGGASAPPVAPPFNPNEGMSTLQISARTAGLNDLTEAAGRAATQMESSGKKSAKVTWEVAKTWDEIDQAVAAATKAGDTYSAQLAMQSGVIMKVNGQITDNIDLHKQAIEQTAKGKTIADVGTWAQGFQRQMQATMQSLAIQGERQRNIEIPYGVYQQTLQQPLIQPGIGFFPTNQAGGIGAAQVARAGLTGPAAGMAGEWLQTATADQQKIRDLAKEGFEAQLADVRTFAPDQAAAFEALNTEATTTSASIADITTRLSKLQQAASQMNWDNQIRIARRALGDALGMMGKVGGTRLGYLEREQWLNSRASQALGLALQQRQVTTQQALAQFQAPGETGEERYQRQKERLAEAGIAQQQLGFSFKDFTVSGEIWKENLERARTDAAASLGVMESARNAEGATIAAQASIAEKEKLLAATIQKMSTITGQSSGTFNAALSAATGGVNDFAGSVKEAVTMIYKTTGVNAYYDKNGVLVVGGGGGGGGGKGPLVKATGFLGSFARGATFTVGEAGPETVAILRNPRTSSVWGGGGWGGGEGGGSPTVNVNINGPVVRNDQDIAALARAVASEVERSLSRKGQLLGLRGPAY